jgi:hypothetical protein
VEQPEDEHLAADVGVGMGIPLRVDDRLLGIRERDPKPSHPWPSAKGAAEKPLRRLVYYNEDAMSQEGPCGV